MNETESKQARILSESGPAAKQSLEVARLCAFLSRIQWSLVAIELLIARRKQRMHAGVARAWRPHRPGTHERDSTRDGSRGHDDVPGFHDEVLGEESSSFERRGGL